MKVYNQQKFIGINKYKKLIQNSKLQKILVLEIQMYKERKTMITTNQRRMISKKNKLNVNSV